MNMDEFDSLLLELIACRPVTRDVEAVNRVADRIAAFAAAHGLFCTTENIGGRHTVFAATEPGKKPDLLLNAHIDVVPAIEEKQYTPKIKDGILYARGAGDCLGNAVTILRFLCSWKKRNAGISVGGVFSADEETGGASTEGMLKLGYAAKKMILVLDTWLDGNICGAQKGILSLKLIAQGKGGHSSEPWKLLNPIDRLMDAYLRLRSAWKNPSSEEDWCNSMTPCVLRAGAVENQVPDSAEMIVNFRYVMDEDREQILDLVRKQTGLDFVILQECPPVYNDTSIPALENLRRIAAEEFGRPDATFTRMCGATDARFWKEAGVPLAIFGLQTFGLHSAEEGLVLNSIPMLMRSLTRLAESLSSVSVSS